VEASSNIKVNKTVFLIIRFVEIVYIRKVLFTGGRE
jgi:hypothetical protein